MKRDVGRFIEVSVKEAERKLEDSERDFEDGSYGSAISHAYYAMYHVARACLARAGVFPRTHKGTVAQFGRCFVETARIERAWEGSRDRTARQADSGLQVHLQQRGARKTLENAKRFVERRRGF